MNRTFSETKLEALLPALDAAEMPPVYARQPAQQVICGADRFRSRTARGIGEAALRSIDSNAPDFVSFARAMWLAGADTLPRYDDLAQELEFELIENAENVKAENYAAWFAWTVYQRTIEKLQREPVEELQIDLIENGQTDREISGAAVSAGHQLAIAFLEGSLAPFTGVRIPSLNGPAARILDLFLTTLIEKTNGDLPADFSVTLTGAQGSEEIAALHALLSEFENRHALDPGSIKITLVIGSPRAVLDGRDRIVLTDSAKAAGGRCTAAHLDADSFLAEIDIPAAHRHPRHEACNFARQMMHLAFSPLNIRLSDSIVPATAVRPGSDIQGVHRAWREHFYSVTHSLIGGFYQGLDSASALLPARYAAVFSFFLEAKDAQGKLLREFIGRAVSAGTDFEDACSARGSLNFFYRALDCGALSEDEVLEIGGLTPEELRGRSFSEIVRRRQYKTAAR